MILPSFDLPLHLILAIGAGWIATIVLVWFIMDLRYYGKEGFIARKCRKGGIPMMIDVDIGSGNASTYAGEKQKKGAGRIFHKSEAGAKIDPAISQGEDEPIRLPRGLDLHIHGTMDGWPTTIRSAAGIQKIKEIRTKPEYRPLERIPDKDVIELLNAPDDHLAHDCKLFIERYKIPNPDVRESERQAVVQKLSAVLKDPGYRLVNWMDLDDLGRVVAANETDVFPLVEQLIAKFRPTTSIEGDVVEIPAELVIKKLDILRRDPQLRNAGSPLIESARMLELVNCLKDEAAHTPIDPKFMALRAALKDNPNAYKTTDITNLENILRQMFTEDWLNKINWMQYGVIIIGIVVAGAVSFAIVSSV